MYLPDQDGVVDLLLTAMETLLVTKLTTEIDTGDVSRAVTIKVGPMQASPDGVFVLLHENDPDDPAQWPHRPVKYNQGRPRDDTVGLSASSDYYLVGGGGLYARAFSAEVVVYGNYLSGVSVDRDDVRRIAAVVENRLIKALKDAGPDVGTGELLQDDFGEAVVDGPYLDEIRADGGGESLIERKVVRVWYRTVKP
jgi:hypothetical protein